MRIKINLDVWLVYIEVFLVIFLSGSWKQGNFNDELDIIKWLMLLIAFLCVIRSLKVQYEWKILVLLLSCSIVYLLFEINLSISINVFMFFLLKFIFFVFFALFASKRNISILEVVGNIVLIIAAYSLIMYILIYGMRMSLPHITYFEHGINYDSYFLFITTDHPNFQLTIGKFQIYRLMSFFWEPGVYQIYLCYALFYFLYCKVKKSTYAIIVLIINIMLTASATGVCVAIFMLGHIIMQKIGKDRKTIFFVIASALIAFLSMAYVWITKMQTSSYFTRMNDFMVGLRVLKEHWLVGSGFQNYTEYIIVRGINRGSSNGLMSWFSSMGLLGGTLLIAPFVLRFRKIRGMKEKELYAIYFVLFIVQNMTEPITNHPFMSLVVAIEYSYLLFRKNENQKLEVYELNERRKLC